MTNGKHEKGLEKEVKNREKESAMAHTLKHRQDRVISRGLERRNLLVGERARKHAHVAHDAALHELAVDVRKELQLATEQRPSWSRVKVCGRARKEYQLSSVK